MRVLHVAEGLASGVLSALTLLATEQAKSGAVVSVLYTREDGTPPEELEQAFSGLVERIEVQGARGVPSPVRLANAFRKVRHDDFDVVHAHSSWAGTAVRATSHDPRRWPHIWYTPHAYGFLKSDIAALTRKAVIAAERGLSRVGSIAAVSESEARLAREIAHAPRVRILMNRMAMDGLPKRQQATWPGRRPRVVCLGRIASQKDPRRFGRLAVALSGEADFVWVGATERDAEVFAGTPVQTVRWTTRDEALAQLADSDIYLSTSAWEGLPLALIEAQAIGLPVVCTNVPGNNDVAVHGVTGFVCNSDQELADALCALIRAPRVFDQMSGDARRSAHERFRVGTLGTESLQMYCEALTR